MSDYDKETIKGFADLCRGGKVAIDTGEFRPWTNHDGTFIEAQGEEYETKIADHLHSEPAIGVYPLFAEEDGLKVYWGCVDWDEGLRQSLTHAKNPFLCGRRRLFFDQKRSKSLKLSLIHI